MSTPRLSWRQALAWRMGRQLLDPPADLPAEEVVRRLCGVQAQVASVAELAVRVRQEASRAGAVASALADGRLMKTWAMRGTLHLLAPEAAGAYLSLLAEGRSWERPSWQRWFRMTPERMERLRSVVREALDGRILSREELIEAVMAVPDLAHLGDGLRSGWGSLLKPLAWHGDLCFGPSRGTRVTFMRPEAASSRWAGVPPADEAAPLVIRAYLAAYGPATAESVGNWISRGRIPKRRLQGWVTALGPALAEVEVDGEPMLVRAEDLDEVAAAAPTDAVRLLPGFDQYVLGPGTDDPHVVPPGRRAAVSRQAGWIAPVVVAGGVVAGTWDSREGRLTVTWFGESGPPPRAALEDEAAHLSTIVGRPLNLEIVES